MQPASRTKHDLSYRPAPANVGACEGAIWAHVHIYRGLGRDSTGLAKIDNLRPDYSGAARALKARIWKCEERKSEGAKKVAEKCCKEMRV